MSEVWNGTTWSVETMPMPSGGTQLGIHGVSCPSYECIAVGQVSMGGKPTTIAERWNGSAWHIQSPMPTPPGNQEVVRLQGVSCTSLSACTAVGQYSVTPEPGDPYETNNTLVERWNGTEWTIQSSPNPTGTIHDLDGVSCSSSTSCMAVGSYGSNAFHESTSILLAESWNGSSWTAISAPAPPVGTGSGALYQVSCSTSSACVAAGGDALEWWNGTEWTLGSWTKPAGENTSEGELTGISCTATTVCTAVGNYNSGSNQLSLAEAIGAPVVETAAPTNVSKTGATLNGYVNAYGYETTYVFEYGTTKSYGTSVPVPAGKFAAGWTKNSVSQTITGINLNETAYHYRLVATNVDSTTYGEDQVIGPRPWTITATPNPSGGSENTLEGVTCPSTTSCFAVGSYKST